MSHVCCLPVLQVYNKEGGAANWNDFMYNEFIVSAKKWNANLPHTIEAFFFKCGELDTVARIRSTRLQFLRAYHLQTSQVPLLCIDIGEWGDDGPFRLMSD